MITEAIPKSVYCSMSKMRKMYFVRFIVRCITLLLCIALYFAHPQSFDVLHGFNFFHEFSVLHILWAVWMFDMICQLVPIKKHIPLGSQKLFAQRYCPDGEKINKEALRKFTIKSTKSAFMVFLVWAAFIAAIATVFYTGMIDKKTLLLISVCFYVCDLICVLFWCPFRLMLKNRCCTTCRIFNWDHLMMFSPLAFVGGFYAGSLLLMALVVLLLWELFIILHPERFWQGSNKSLQCASCTDKLCTQYCGKRR